MKGPFVITLIVFIYQSLAGQTFNNRLSFHVGSREEGFSCYEIDGKYIFVGGYFDTSNAIRGGMFALDLSGQVTESSTFFNDSSVYFISGSSGGDYLDDLIIAGGSYRGPTDENGQGIIIGFNSNGDTLFSNKYSYVNEDVIFYKGLIADNGYLGCGIVDDSTDLVPGILVKFDLNGNFLWRKDYPPQNNLSVFLYSADQTPDGGYLLGGAQVAAPYWDHLVIKTDSLGNEEWRILEGNEFDNGIAKVAITGDGKYVFCGYHSASSVNNQSPQVTKLDLDGDTLWSKYYGNPGFDKSATSIKLLPDGGFVFCGVDRFNLEYHGFIRRIDANGNEIWYRRYQQAEGASALFNDVFATSDDGFILTGMLFSDNDLNLEQDMWAMKLDSYGCLVPGCQLVTVNENNPAAMSIYPNPCDDFINVYVESLNSGQCTLSLYDAQGRLVREIAVRDSGSTWMIESSTLPEGVYILQLRSDGNVMASEKVVVRR